MRRQEVGDNMPDYINAPSVSTTHSLHRHVHCVEGALENKVRIQLIHLLNELVHPTLSLVRHHKELHTLVSKGPFQHGKFKVTVKTTEMNHHTLHNVTNTVV